MDILTPKGQATLADEKRAMEIFVRNFPCYTFIETPKDRPADIDALLVMDNVIRAVVETKCRYDCDLSKFRGQYGNEWLVTFSKLQRAQEAARALCVKVVGLVYLKQSDALLVQEVISANGLYVPSVRLATTVTQSSINGGQIERTNAFIDMSHSRLLSD